MRIVILAALVLNLMACEAAYYGLNEKFGRLKNDILVDRVEDAMQAQEEAKQEFKDALQQFEAVVRVEETALKRIYNRLSDAFEDAQSKADKVVDRVDAVEDVAGDLFAEWQDELEQIIMPIYAVNLEPSYVLRSAALQV